ncbi:MAG: metallophosphoesterase [Bacteroidia bacterium]|jgi:hypothetical protein
MLAFKIKLLLSVIAFILVIDIYSWQAFRTLIRDKSQSFRLWVRRGYFGITVFTIVMFLLFNLSTSIETNATFRYYFMAATFVLYFPKFITMIFLLIDDAIRAVRWAIKTSTSMIRHTPVKQDVEEGGSSKISRAKFLSQTGAIAGAVPFVVLSKGIIRGAYDYQVHRVPLYLKNLPFAFEGLKVVQLSDIHTGSLFDKDSVHRGIQMAMAEKPDLVFFTGDLVNSETKEAYDLMDHFAQIKAPMGVHSIFGNHDYGDYRTWDSPADKAKNLEDLVKVHRDMGWNLLRNEHVLLEKGGQQIALIGVENWGDKGRFQKFGDIEKATKGLQDVPVQLLLSHDPSHFDSVVTKNHPEIDAMFAGHTHGFQFGIENAFIKWSPSKYIYPRWAGLYREENQQIYVNRGYGFLGYPGRIGILPEITVFELRRA